MLGDQFKFLAWFYVNPRKAAGAVLDHGQFLFALIAAALVTFALSSSAEGAKGREYIRLIQQTAPAELMNDAVEGLPTVHRQLEARYFATSFKSIVVMAVVFVPVSILLLAAFCHLGGGLTILFRDYMPVLAGLLFAWAAAFLPVAIAAWAGYLTVPLQAAGLAYFLFLAVPVLSTVMGIGLAPATGAAAGALAASLAAGVFAANSGNLLYMFASPWLLYYAYQTFGRDLSALGGGLSARQNFKRQLEAATLNPRDADAHYQLGLIYLQRRSLEEAEKSFRRALSIDPDEPDTLFHLGRLLRQQGRADEARQLLERGAQIDPKLSSHQVWRELGALTLPQNPAQALQQLEYYVQLREYDPEGLVLYGRALRAMQKPQEARAAFEKAIEAVRTAPKFRRSELAPWEKQAHQELKA